MTETACPFCGPPEGRLFHDGRLVVGLWDRFPVSPGHALLIPRRHVAGWFDATDEERSELIAAIETARIAIEREHRPDGYNIGINLGEAAGQTVFHLHVHVIPRYRGDVAEPRGGVRHVIPDRADYVREVGEAVRRPYSVAGGPWLGPPDASRLLEPHPTGGHWCAAATIRFFPISGRTWPARSGPISRWRSCWSVGSRRSRSTSRISSDDRARASGSSLATTWV